MGGGGTRSIWGKGLLAICLTLLAIAGFAQGQEQQAETLDLRALVEKQQKQLEQQQRQIQELTERLQAVTADTNGLPKPRPVQEGQQSKDTPPGSGPRRGIIVY